MQGVLESEAGALRLRCRSSANVPVSFVTVPFRSISELPGIVKASATPAIVACTPEA